MVIRGLSLLLLVLCCVWKSNCYAYIVHSTNDKIKAWYCLFLNYLLPNGFNGLTNISACPSPCCSSPAFASGVAATCISSASTIAGTVTPPTKWWWWRRPSPGIRVNSTAHRRSLRWCNIFIWWKNRFELAAIVDKGCVGCCCCCWGAAAAFRVAVGLDMITTTCCRLLSRQLFLGRLKKKKRVFCLLRATWIIRFGNGADTKKTQSSVLWGWRRF